MPVAEKQPFSPQSIQPLPTHEDPLPHLIDEVFERPPAVVRLHHQQLTFLTEVLDIEHRLNVHSLGAWHRVWPGGRGREMGERKENK